jgi:streptogramin lyase
MTNYPIPYDPSSHIYSIVTGPDGDLWFSETGSMLVWSRDHFYSAPIGRLSLDGVYFNFSVGDVTTSADSNVIAGADGKLWFIGSSPTTVFVGRIDPATLEVTQFPLRSGPATFRPLMTRSSTGEIWFMDNGRIGRITSSGSITRCILPDSCSSGYCPTQPWSIAVGPDGNLWYTSSIRVGSGYAVGYVSRQ